ncbi:PTS glucose transporter subunit IIA [Gracilibacillus caseinilyticus]|uniref:PTS glucose transporter subunit IIA n=1 Tax=Gracilibacillus caseinilyticus TaxID=2932256 RepID=A0ABY4EQK1_9BACI|nr:PTS glucose transporter subunit IIA [Gracilibacillus caseinilyticus]UOQ46720.1 PTS glucose transporter subunit IIA [Gracilibacillus caseinilyticus]
MFKKLFNKSKKVELLAPLTGKVVALGDVPDPVFSQKMMGEGIAITPETGKVIAPVDATIVQIPETKHAIGMKTNGGVEILIHVGLETVGLKGEGFNILVKEGEKVAAGQMVMEFDLDYIHANAEDTVTPMVITNSKDLDQSIQLTNEKQCEAGETSLLTLS